MQQMGMQQVCLTQIAQAVLNTSLKVFFFFNRNEIYNSSGIYFNVLLFCKEMLYISSNHLQMDGKGRMCLGIPNTRFTNNPAAHLRHSSAPGESPADIKDKEGSTGLMKNSLLEDLILMLTIKENRRYSIPSKAKTLSLFRASQNQNRNNLFPTVLQRKKNIE